MRGISAGKHGLHDCCSNGHSDLSCHGFAVFDGDSLLYSRSKQGFGSHTSRLCTTGAACNQNHAMKKKNFDGVASIYLFLETITSEFTDILI